jgi:hypothetical protein
MSISPTLQVPKHRGQGRLADNLKQPVDRRSVDVVDDEKGSRPQMRVTLYKIDYNASVGKLWLMCHMMIFIRFAERQCSGGRTSLI